NDEAQPPAKTAPGPRVELAVQELDVLVQELDLIAGKGKVDPADFDRLKARVGAARALIAPGKELLQTPSDAPGMADELKRLQGKWRLVLRRSGSGSGPRESIPTADDPRELVIESRGNKIIYA